MRINSSVIFSLALLLIPLAFWLERTYPEAWKQRLFAAFSEAEDQVKCIDAETVILGTAETGYKVVELSTDSRTCQHSSTP